MAEAKSAWRVNEEKVEKGLKKMHEVVQFFSRLVEGEDDPLVRLALLDASSKTVACIYRIAIERANISESRKDLLKKGFLNYLHTIMEGDLAQFYFCKLSFLNYLHTIMEGDGIKELLAEEETK